MTFCRKSEGFTLAEVLITLGIIGIVAALTLPSIIQKQNEKASVTALKKFYSNINQAYALVINANGTPDTWNLDEDKKVSSNLIFEKFKPYLKIIRVCESGKEYTCFNKNIVYKNMDGTVYSGGNPFPTFQTFVLADGSIAFFEIIDKDCKGSFGAVNDICMTVYVDLNGDKGPNVLGEDYHGFKMTSKGLVIPQGSNKFDGSVLGFKENCGKDKNGRGCTAWMLYNENMDFLHCMDKLDWNGKKSCK